MKFMEALVVCGRMEDGCGDVVLLMLWHVSMLWFGYVGCCRALNDIRLD